MTVPGEMRIDAVTVAQGFFALATLIEAFDECTEAGRDLDEATIREAVAPLAIGPEAEEVGCLAGLDDKVREILARSLGSSRRELELSLAEGRAGATGVAAAVDEARKRLCGALRIVARVSGEALPGFLDACWTLHGCD